MVWKFIFVIPPRLRGNVGNLGGQSLKDLLRRLFTRKVDKMGNHETALPLVQMLKIITTIAQEMSACKENT